MSELIKLRLEDKSLSDLKVILDYCKDNYTKDIKWAERAICVKKVLSEKINSIFE
jgi:hypothetical protein